MIAKGMVRNAWYVAGFSDEFPRGELKGQQIVSKPLVMWRAASGKVVAFDGRCVHKRMPLAEGRFIEEDVLECPYHGFCFNDTGQCVKIPALPNGPIPARARLKEYPVVEQHGLVWIWPGDRERIGECTPPKTPEITSNEWESIGSEPIHVPANYQLLIENLLDVTHFYPLHNGNVGNVEHSLIPIEIVQEKVDGNDSVMTIRNAKRYKQPPYFADWFGYEVVDRHHTHCMMNPGLTRVQMRVAPPDRLGTEAERGFVLYHTHTPVDERHHVWRWYMNARADHRAGSDPSKSLVQHMVESFPNVVAEDLWALEKQQEMFAYPEDGYSEVHIKSDKAVIRVRQTLAALQAKEQGFPPPIAEEVIE